MERMTVEQALAVVDEAAGDNGLVEEALATLRAELDGLRKLSSRAYVAEQMRGLVPGEITWNGDSDTIDCTDWYNNCRAETLDNIERWEQQP